MSSLLAYVGLIVCRCGAPFCRECGGHCERVENVGLSGWVVAGWACSCGWRISDAWNVDDTPTAHLN